MKVSKNNLLHFLILILAGVLGLISYPPVTMQLELAYHPKEHFIIALLVVTAVGGFLYGRASRAGNNS